MARLPKVLTGIVAGAALLLAPGATPAATPADAQALTAQLAVFRSAMRHPQDEVRAYGVTLTPEEAALAALRTSRLIADTSQVRVWVAIEDGRLRLLSSPKTLDPANGPAPVVGEAPGPTWSAFFGTHGYAGGAYRVGAAKGTRVLLVPDGATRARLVHRDGTSKRLVIRRNAIVTRAAASDHLVWRDAAGRRHAA